jgi:hypothetical protein
MRLDVLDHAVVDERELSRRATLDLLERPLPGLEVDLRRGTGRQHERARWDTDTGGVARVERSGGVEVRHVV